MLEIRKLNIKMQNDREIINNLNLNVNSGDKIAIIGEEGNGKSTLLKCIYNTNLISSYCMVTGEIVKKNIKLGYLEQFLDSKWNDVSIENYFFKDTPDSEIDYERYGNINEIYRIFTEIRLNIDYINSDKLIGTLSGGEKVKIQISKLIFDKTNILLLDEPTNDLDIDALEWLEDFIINSKLPIIYVSHDETLLENTANTILHLEQINNKKEAKHTIERIGYNEYVEKRLYLISKQEQISKKEHAEYDDKMKKYRQIYERVHNEQNNISRQNPSGGRLLKKKMKSVKALGKRLENEELTEKPYVEEQILVKFHNDDKIHDKKVILDFKLVELKMSNNILSKNIELFVIGKEKLAIIGSNGIGKTTLLKLIYDNLKVRTDIKVGYMPQNYEELLDESSTVLDFVKDEYTKEEETLARTYMGSMKFTVNEMTGKIGNLSGGQKAKLFLIKLILEKCDVLVLDEPTRNLSPLSNPVIRETLCNFHGCIISISHDRKYVTEVCDTVYKLTNSGLNKLTT